MHYKARLQPTVAGSTTKREIMQSSDCGQGIFYTRSVLYNLGVPQDAKTVAYEDNDATLLLANVQKPTPCT